ncbi:hypothetical protein CHN51_04150 [Sphingorhabdus sp. YGSMI21]|nr:hypothetical protein CHN51_04150 [Sphingorhabdus sp. YGSMI21]
MQWPVLDEGRDVAAQRADQQALLARAIARQTSSQSARKFVAAKHDAGGAKQPLHASFMDDRMAFFAGRSRSGTSGYREAILFRTGSFRPDLAQQGIDKMRE